MSGGPVIGRGPETQRCLRLVGEFTCWRSPFFEGPRAALCRSEESNRGCNSKLEWNVERKSKDGEEEEEECIEGEFLGKFRSYKEQLSWNSSLLWITYFTQR